MNRYRLPPASHKGFDVTAELAAAAGFVWQVDSGEPMNAEAARVLRDALESILEGADPRGVFPTQRKRGDRATQHDRDWVVACYVESRRRVHESAGKPFPLARGKKDAAEAFDWKSRGVEDADSAISAAWKAHGSTFARFDDAMLARLLAPWGE